METIEVGIFISTVFVLRLPKMSDGVFREGAWKAFKKSKTFFQRKQGKVIDYSDLEMFTAICCNSASNIVS